MLIRVARRKSKNTTMLNSRVWVAAGHHGGMTGEMELDSVQWTINQGFIWEIKTRNTGADIGSGKQLKSLGG